LYLPGAAGDFADFLEAGAGAVELVRGQTHADDAERVEEL
jgi:hypothetical protein